ncbi:MAG: SLATT domain-containing protein [Acidobacteriota bacterium]
MTRNEIEEGDRRSVSKDWNQIFEDAGLVDVPEDDSELKRAEEIHRRVVRRVRSAIDWYWRERARHGAKTKTLRLMIVLSAAIGFLVPVGNLIAEDLIMLDLGYAAFGVAAAIFAVLQSLGYSAGWQRYVRTSFALQQLLEIHLLRRQEMLACWKISSASTSEQVRSLIHMDRRLLAKCHETVRRETETWALRFREDLEDLSQRINQQRS